MKSILEYFIEQTDERLARIESKVDKLGTRVWFIYGSSSVIAAVISAFVAGFFE